MLKYTIFQKNKARGDSTWYGRCFDTVSKEVKVVSIGVKLKRQAEGWLRSRVSESVSGIKDLSFLTIDKAISSFMKNKQCTDLTKRAYTTSFNHIKVFCAENCITRFNDLTPIMCSSFFSTLSSLKASSRKRVLSHISTWVKWIYKAYEIKGVENPFNIVVVEKADPPKRDFWTMEQLEQILSAAKRRDDRLCFALMAYAGLRIHEAMKLKGADIHDGKIHLIGKGHKEATIPVSNRLKAELEIYGELPSGRIVTAKSTHVMAYRIKSLFKNHPELDFGGIPHPHRFRHSFASNLARASVPIPVIMRLMRHSSIQTTMIYSHLLPSDLDDAINKV